VRRTLFDTGVCDDPGIAAEKMGNKENVALQAINPRIINDLTRKKENATSRRGQDGDLYARLFYNFISTSRCPKLPHLGQRSAIEQDTPGGVGTKL
jgi:hypothetical protein